MIDHVITGSMFILQLNNILLSTDQGYYVTNQLLGKRLASCKSV